MFHPGGHFLSDIAALAEIDAVQAFEPGLQQIGVFRDQLDPGLGDAMGDAQGIPIDVPGGQGLGGDGQAIGAPAERRVARVGKGALRGGAEAAGDGHVHRRDLHVGAQAIHGQAAQGGRGDGVLDVDQQMIRVGGPDHEEIGQILALRRQKGGPDQAGGLFKGQHVIADQTLQKLETVGPRDLKNGPV